MTLIKSHTCTTCGGALVVHSGRQQYECPYCSVFYDYEYFRSEDILDQADSSLRILQYDSAKEKYDFVLQKEPNNFRALTGTLLCDAKINRVSGLGKIGNVFHLDPSLIKETEEKARPEDKPFFSKLFQMREYAEIHAEKLKKIEELEKLAQQKGALVQGLAVEELKRENPLEKRETQITLWKFGFLLLIIVPLPLCKLIVETKLTTLLGIIGLIIMIIAFIILICWGVQESIVSSNRKKLAQKLEVSDAGYGPVYTQEDLELLRTLEVLKKSEKNTERTFEKLYKELVAVQPKRRSNSGEPNEELMDADLSKSPSCTKCGGELIVNLNSQVYECPFCGVTFDFDFLRDETAVDDAREAVSGSQFVKADGIWKYILAIEPGNFEALRGRILCVAKWKNIPSKNALSSMERIHLPTLEKRVNEAASSCEEKDKRYFDKFVRVVEEYEKYRENMNPGEPARKQHSILLKKFSDQTNYVSDLACVNFKLEGEMTEKRLESLYLEKTYERLPAAQEFMSAYEVRDSIKKDLDEASGKVDDLNAKTEEIAERIGSKLKDLIEMEKEKGIQYVQTGEPETAENVAEDVEK